MKANFLRVLAFLLASQAAAGEPALSDAEFPAIPINDPPLPALSLPTPDDYGPPAPLTAGIRFSWVCGFSFAPSPPPPEIILSASFAPDPSPYRGWLRGEPPFPQDLVLRLHEVASPPWIRRP